MNDHEAERIAASINQLRPDWPVSSLLTLIRRPSLMNRPRRDVAVALAWVASESESKTPARVIEKGPWWIATGAEGGEDQRWMPPKAENACAHHPGEWRDRCRACAANVLAGRPEHEGENDWMRRRLPAKARDELLSEARAAIADAQVEDVAKRAERDAHVAQQAASRDADRKAREANAATEGDAA